MCELFEKRGDKVEVHDNSQYNFAPPIMAGYMIREQVLKGALRNYARFYMLKGLFSYPWIEDKFKRRYMLDCL